MNYILIVISAILVNNIVLMKFLGICPFLGVSKRLSTATGMTGAVAWQSPASAARGKCAISPNP